MVFKSYNAVIKKGERVKMIFLFAQNPSREKFYSLQPALSMGFPIKNRNNAII
jgi:hypothetical protein